MSNRGKSRDFYRRGEADFQKKKFKICLPFEKISFFLLPNHYLDPGNFFEKTGQKKHFEDFLEKMHF